MRDDPGVNTRLPGAQQIIQADGIQTGNPSRQRYGNKLFAHGEVGVMAGDLAFDEVERQIEDTSRANGDAQATAIASFTIQNDAIITQHQCVTRANAQAGDATRRHRPGMDTTTRLENQSGRGLVFEQFRAK